VLYDYRPVAVSTFCLKSPQGYESETGGALNMFVSRRSGQILFHVAYGTSGLCLVK